jgi:hypothetical protein
LYGKSLRLSAKNTCLHQSFVTGRHCETQKKPKGD